jgi:hypothetical protein
VCPEPLPTATVIHLSLTGWGSAQQRRLCTARVQGGETQWHAMYCSQTQLADPRLCPACLTVWNDDSDDSRLMP